MSAFLGGFKHHPWLNMMVFSTCFCDAQEEYIAKPEYFESTFQLQTVQQLLTLESLKYYMATPTTTTATATTTTTTTTTSSSTKTIPPTLSIPAHWESFTDWSRFVAVPPFTPSFSRSMDCGDRGDLIKDCHHWAHSLFR